MTHHESFGLGEGSQAHSHDFGEAAHHKHGWRGNGYQQSGEAGRRHVPLHPALQSSQGTQA